MPRERNAGNLVDGDARPAPVAGVSGLARGRGLLSHEEWQQTKGVLGLSSRELELVQHIFDGKKLAAIARDMKLSLGTVKTYSQRIHHKVHVSDQRELIPHAAKNNALSNVWKLWVMRKLKAARCSVLTRSKHASMAF